MSVLKPVYNIYQLKMYPILNILTFGCRFPCRADNATYPHDGRADKRRYRHDRRADSQCRFEYQVNFGNFISNGQCSPKFERPCRTLGQTESDFLSDRATFCLTGKIGDFPNWHPRPSRRVVI